MTPSFAIRLRVAASLVVLSVVACGGGDEDVYPYEDLDRVADLTCRGERAPDSLPPISPSRKKVWASLMDPARGVDEGFRAESLPELSYVLCGDVVYTDVVGTCGPYLGEGGGSVTLFQVAESLRYRLVDPRSLETVASITFIAPADVCPMTYTGAEGADYDTLPGVPLSGPFDCLLHHTLGDTTYVNQPYCWPRDP